MPAVGALGMEATATCHRLEAADIAFPLRMAGNSDIRKISLICPRALHGETTAFTLKAESGQV
jgi:hypothetical protein